MKNKIYYPCPSCGKRLRFKVGVLVRCPACGETFLCRAYSRKPVKSG